MEIMSNNNPIKVSIILPCRNKEKALGLCIKKTKLILKNNTHVYQLNEL